MIGKILKLTYNELIKQFKKRSITLIIICILILAILAPIGMQRINLDDRKYTIYTNELNLKSAETQIEALKNINTEEGKLQLEWALINKEYWQFMKDNNIGYKDWKNNVLDGYEENAYSIIILNKIIKGIDKKILINNPPKAISLEKIEEYTNLSRAALNKKLSEFTKINEEKINIVINNDYMKYLSNLIKEKEEIIALQNKEIKKDNEELKVKVNDKEILKDLEYVKNNRILNEKILNIYKYRYNNKIGFEENDWKNKTLIDIEECEEKIANSIVTEEEFNKGAIPGMNTDRMSYEDYKQFYNSNKIYIQEKINKDWYSLNNNLPQLEFIRDSRTLVESVYNIFLILTILLLIIIGGGIVSSEFSKGTIRLLMIRPVSRWKILLSKLLCLFVIAYSIIILSLLILVITSGFILEFNTLQRAVIETVGGKIVVVPYIQYIFTKVVMSSASVLFIISLVFMISTLLKNTALSVSISTIVYLISMPLTLILGFSNKKWIVNTIIPYINESMLNLIPDFAKILEDQSGVKLNPTWGAVQLVIVSSIMLIITFLIFQRKDIKN